MPGPRLVIPHLQCVRQRWRDFVTQSVRVDVEKIRVVADEGGAELGDRFIFIAAARARMLVSADNGKGAHMV